jgi:hypothetical protein
MRWEPMVLTVARNREVVRYRCLTCDGTGRQHGTFCAAKDVWPGFKRNPLCNCTKRTCENCDGHGYTTHEEGRCA